MGGSIRLAYPLPSVLHAEEISLTYALSHTEETGPVRANLDPNAPPPSVPRRGFNGSVRAVWAWSDARASVGDISPSEGRAMRFELELTHPLFGSPFSDLHASWALAQYVENPLVERHVLALRYAGGLSTSSTRFPVGGYAQQDYLDALVDLRPLPTTPLRGFPVGYRFGSQFHVLGAEYLFPIATPEWSVGTLPLYLGQLWGLAFFDAGNAFTGAFDLERFAFGTGGELIVELVVGYYVNVRLRLGVARGIGGEGETQFYLHLGSSQ